MGLMMGRWLIWTKKPRRFVSIGGLLLSLCARRDPGGYAVWIASDSEILHHVSYPVSPRLGLDADSELVFMAPRPGSPLSEAQVLQVCLQSGWFSEARRTVRYPASERSPILLIAEQLRQSFTASRSHTTFAPSLKLGAFLRMWLHSAAPAGSRHAVVCGPDPLDPTMSGRRIVGFSSGVQEAMLARIAGAEAVREGVSVVDLRASAIDWHLHAAQEGLRMLLVASHQIVAGRSFDVFVLSTRYDEGVARDTLFQLARAWPAMRQLIAEDSPLAEREVQFLALASYGLTTDQIAAQAGCSKQNVRYHLDKAAKKLAAPNTTGAVLRAQLLGAL